MSDETPSTERGEPEGPLAGERLAAARRERDISVLDIAKELHLDEPKVRALEENRFETLGAPVFAKGHLRKYAELVGVPIADVLADYYSLNRAVGAPPVVGAPRKRERNIRIGPWIVGIFVLLLLAAAVYWWLERDGDSPLSGAIRAPQTQLALPSQESTPDVTAEPQPLAESSSPGAPEDAARAPEPVAVSPSVAADAVEPAAVAATGPAEESADNAQVTLAMRFSGDCWTEVTDTTGARLFFDLGLAGRTVEVSGDPPLRVLFGNGDNVTVTVDGRDFPILASMRRGRTARFTISSQ